jgi:hypothetical protein
MPGRGLKRFYKLETSTLILTRVEIFHVRKPSSWLTEGRWFYPGAARAWNNARRGTWGLPPPIKLEKIDDKISAGRYRMARLECTVAHMGFPAATLNKRIKKKTKKTCIVQFRTNPLSDSQNPSRSHEVLRVCIPCTEESQIYCRPARSAGNYQLVHFAICSERKRPGPLGSCP